MQNCPSCFETAMQPYDPIMNQQNLLFDGYIRIKMLDSLPKNDLTKVVSTDVINVCSIFFKQKINSLMNEHLKLLLVDRDNGYEWFKHTKTVKEKQESELFILIRLGNQ